MENWETKTEEKKKKKSKLYYCRMIALLMCKPVDMGRDAANKLKSIWTALLTLWLLLIHSCLTYMQSIVFTNIASQQSNLLYDLPVVYLFATSTEGRKKIYL